MSDESVVKAFERQVVKPSEWIRRGISVTPETRTPFLSNGCGCALGAAYRAKTGASEQPPNPWVLGAIADEIGIPEHIACFISSMHYRETWTREQCADYAESQGY